MNFSLRTAIIIFSTLARAQNSGCKGSEDRESNRELAVFLLQDSHDGLCLGPLGFSICDESSLWVYAERSEGEGYSIVSLLEPDPSKSCLSRRKPNSAYGNKGNFPVLIVQSCSKHESKHWEIEGPNTQGYFRLTSNFDHTGASKRKYCATRYKGGGFNSPGPKGRLRNSVSILPCDISFNDPIGFETGYVPLDIIETPIHDAGFYLQTVDSLCFDGTKFLKCEMISNMLWGVDITFNGRKGEIERRLFHFHQPSLCLKEEKQASSVELGYCDSKEATRWGLKNGKLTRENGRVCVVRLLDNGASIRPCHEAFEFLQLVIPEQSRKAREQVAQYHQKIKANFF